MEFLAVSEGLVDMGPFIGLLSLIIGWGGFIIVLSMLKKFISHGLSVALGEFLFRQCSMEQVEKITRWFADGEAVAEHIKELHEKLTPDDVKKE